MKRLLFAALAGAMLVGCGDGTFKPNAVVSEVDPSYGVSGRTVSVVVRGDFTKWREGGLEPADVSFGEGITVDAVTVGNEGVLHVDLTIAADAAIGPRDVAVENEHLHAGYRVVPAFWIGEPVITPGGWLVIDAFGIETEWAPGRTAISIEGEGTDIFTKGTDYFGLTSDVIVHDRDYLQIIAWADFEAVAGPREVTISGATITDSVPGALTVGTIEPLAVTPGTSTLSIRGGDAVYVELPVPAAGEAHAYGVDYLDGHPLGFAFDPDLGVLEGQIGSVASYDVPSAGSFFAAYSRAFFATDKSYRVMFYEANFVAELQELAAGNRAMPPTTATREFEATFAAHAETLAAGTPATGETLAFTGDTRAWRITPADRWSIVRADVTNVDPEFDPRLRLVRSTGIEGADAIGFGNFGNDGDPESLATLAGSRLDAMVLVSDADGESDVANSIFDVEWTETAIPGTFFEASGADQAITDADTTVFTFDVTGSNIAALSEVHLALDIEHSAPQELVVTLMSPLGTTRTAFNGGAFDRPGIKEVYPDTATPNQAFNFTGTADGTWTLTITDDTQGNEGTLKGWALSFE